jgi:AMP nucleosidase
MPSPRQNLPVETPETPPRQAFSDAAAAVARLEELYAHATAFLRAKFDEALANPLPLCRYRAFYPEVRLTTASYASVDSRLSFGHVTVPGAYATTITRPDLFRNYLTQQIGLILENHGVPVEIGASEVPIPIHFAMGPQGGAVPQDGTLDFTLRDVFDVPDLDSTNDAIVNGDGYRNPDGSAPLAPFTAQRVDYSLAAGALHRHRSRAFPEPCAVHQLPVLCRRVHRLCPRRAGRSGIAATPASSPRAGNEIIRSRRPPAAP